MLQKSIMPVLHNFFSIFKMLQPAPRDCGPKEQRSRKQRSSGAAEQRSSGRHGMLSVVTIYGATGTITTTSDSTAPRAFPPLPLTPSLAHTRPAPASVVPVSVRPLPSSPAHACTTDTPPPPTHGCALRSQICMHPGLHAHLRAAFQDMYLTLVSFFVGIVWLRYSRGVVGGRVMPPRRLAKVRPSSRAMREVLRPTRRGRGMGEHAGTRREGASMWGEHAGGVCVYCGHFAAHAGTSGSLGARARAMEYADPCCTVRASLMWEFLPTGIPQSARRTAHSESRTRGAIR